MGNIVLTCVPVVPSEEEKDIDDVGGDGKVGASAASGVSKKGPDFMSEAEVVHEPPTTITKVLSNALYAMAFHKHLALT